MYISNFLYQKVDKFPVNMYCLVNDGLGEEGCVFRVNEWILKMNGSWIRFVRFGIVSLSPLSLWSCATVSVPAAASQPAVISSSSYQQQLKPASSSSQTSLPAAICDNLSFSEQQFSMTTKLSFLGQYTSMLFSPSAWALIYFNNGNLSNHVEILVKLQLDWAT